MATIPLANIERSPMVATLGIAMLSEITKVSAVRPDIAVHPCTDQPAADIPRIGKG